MPSIHRACCCGAAGCCLGNVVGTLPIRPTGGPHVDVLASHCDVPQSLWPAYRGTWTPFTIDFAAGGPTGSWGVRAEAFTLTTNPVTSWYEAMSATLYNNHTLAKRVDGDLIGYELFGNSALFLETLDHPANWPESQLYPGRFQYPPPATTAQVGFDLVGGAAPGIPTGTLRTQGCQYIHEIDGWLNGELEGQAFTALGYPCSGDPRGLWSDRRIPIWRKAFPAIPGGITLSLDATVGMFGWEGGGLGNANSIELLFYQLYRPSQIYNQRWHLLRRVTLLNWASAGMSSDVPCNEPFVRGVSQQITFDAFIQHGAPYMPDFLVLMRIFPNQPLGAPVFGVVYTHDLSVLFTYATWAST